MTFCVSLRLCLTRSHVESGTPALNVDLSLIKGPYQSQAALTFDAGTLDLAYRDWTHAKFLTGYGNVRSNLVSTYHRNW